MPILQKSPLKRLIKSHALALVFALLMALFMALDSTLLQYHRDAILDGECWRLFTGQWVHLGLAHALVNLAALALIAGYWPAFGNRHWLVASFVGQLCVALGLFIFSPSITWYVGASGWLYGVAVCFSLLRRNRWDWLVLAYLFARVVVEWLWSQTGQAYQQWLGGAVVTQAHFYGLMGGLFSALLLSQGQYVGNVLRGFYRIIMQRHHS